MAPLIAGGLIAAGGSILGGLLNNRESRNNRAFEREMWEEGLRRQTMSWRVNDAKAAGVHPLFAIGSGAASLPSIAVGGGSGSSFGDSVAEGARAVGSAVANRDERELDHLNKLLAIQALRKGDAEIDLLQSQAARERNEAFRTSAPWVRPTDRVEATGADSYAVSRIPTPQDEVYGSPLATEGKHPGMRFPDKTAEAPVPLWTPFQAKDGIEIDLPSNAASQSLESVGESLALQMMVLQRNIEKHGGNVDKVLTLFAGVPQFKEAVALFRKMLESGSGVTQFFRGGGLGGMAVEGYRKLFGMFGGGNSKPSREWKPTYRSWNNAKE